MAIIVNTQKEMDRMREHGYQIEEGFSLAFDHDVQLKGVVNNETQLFHATLPLNGWRSRNLAEEVLGERDGSLWTLGHTMVVSLAVLRNLPGFDQKYYDMLKTLEEVLGAKMGVIRVVEVDPGYGCHITLSTGAKGTVFE